MESEPRLYILFWRVFFTRTGIHFARKRSSLQLHYSSGGHRPIRCISRRRPSQPCIHGLPNLMPKIFSDPEAIAEDIIRDVGTNLVVGLPLGLGKANHIVNALYARAVADPYINLTFFSALTLEKPRPSNLLERRFISPVIDRLFGGYPDLVYADALHAGALPPNVQVIEFFFLAGKWLHVPYAQQHYISANYTHASSYLLARGLNVVHATGRQTRGRRRRALQSELQHRHHAGRVARPRPRQSGVQAGRPGQFRVAVHAGRGRSAGGRIQRGARGTGGRISAVRAAGRADHRHQIRHRPSRRRPGARRRHASDRHRPGRRRAGAGADRSPPRQRAVSRDHEAARARSGIVRAGADRIVRKGPLRRQRDAVRGVSRPDRCRHHQARGGWRRAARRFLPRTEIVLSRACATGRRKRSRGSG